MRKFWTYLVIIFQVGLIVSLLKGIQLSIGTSGRVSELEEQKNKLLKEKQELEKQYEYVQSPEYLEKIARDELNLTREGETVVVVPEGSNQYAVNSNQGEKQKPTKNWEKWAQVLFGRI